MNRNNSSDGGPDMKRPESYPPPLTFKQQQILSPQQQKQIQAQQQIQQQQYQAQQQQQFQMQQQIQEFQQQQQQQQIQEYQQQQQFAANQQYYNQAAFYNFQPYVPPQSPLLYNSGPSWNFITAPPPPFFGSSPSSSTPHPPLPPPDLKLDLKPPLPKEPEPGNDNKMGIRKLGPGALGSGPSGGNSGPRPQGTIRVRGLNGINAGVFNGTNSGIRPNGSKNRRKNAHFNSHMQPLLAPGPLAQDLTQMTEFSDLAPLLDEDVAYGADKFTIFLNKSENSRVQVNKKAKRKPMSTRYARTKGWIREEAEAALALEKEYNRMQKRPMLILKFPDPDLNKYIVKKYSPLIETVHFQQPSTPRYCFVQLKDDADVEKVANTIRQIPFGTGKIGAEVKNHHVDDQPVTADEIDPYTLYIGNLPTHISVRVVKQYFPNAQRIDIGYAQRMRYTRYAFIRYNTVAEAMDSYRKTVNALLDSRSLIVRFRRQKGNIGLPGEPRLKLQKLEDQEETDVTEQNATENDEVPTEDDLAEGDPCAAEDDEGAEKVENVSKDVQEEIRKVETVSEESLSTPAPEDVNPKSTTGTDEESQASNTLEVNDSAKDVTNPPEHIEIPVSASTEKQITSAETAASTEKQITSAETAASTENQITSAETAASTEQQITSAERGETLATLNSPESLGDDLDNKDKVLQEARELMRKNQELRAVSPINFSAFKEPTDVPKGPVEGDIKLEQSEDEDSSDDGGINLLGTRVKDEPFEAPNRAPIDELYFDDYDYDDLCTDIEDDDDNWSTNSDSRSRQLLATNWELVRRSELNARDDKPDLSDISSVGASSKEISSIKVNAAPKEEIDDLEQEAANKMKRDQLAVKQELEDMFNRLNSDIECDDDDAFFG